MSLRGASYWATGGLLLLLLASKFPLFALTLLLAYGSTGGRHRSVLNALRTLPRDLHILKSSGVALLLGLYYYRHNIHVIKLFQSRVKKHPKKVAFMNSTSKWTYEEVEEFSNKIGHYFKEKVGLRRGDTVALVMKGRPEYICIWLGLAKLGVVTALINTNQRKSALQHSIDIINSSIIIYGPELTEALLELGDEKLKSFKLFSQGSGEIIPGTIELENVLEEQCDTSLLEDINKTKINDKLLYIYTSGTTGLPKAAVITHSRYLTMGLGVYKSINGSIQDTMYTPLPLYHSAGGIVGVSQALIGSSTVFIRPNFSASNFWKDCIKYKCTAAQYIGETCRYLLNCPERPEESQHSIRVMLGNGLRPQIWSQFVERFKIPWIVEFYGATEGNANLINVWNKVGAVGYVPWFAKSFYPVKLIKVVDETNEPLRGHDGLCMPSEEGEPGLLVSKIKDQFGRNYSGYSDKEASKKKILTDVFEKGDKAFNSGDVLVSDEQGYFYFKDRTGDTFRWKGENVATLEVEAIISNIIGLKDAIVYGVQIPNTDGRTGMAAIVDQEGSLDLTSFYKGINESLPSYARPFFIRILKKPPLTATFKLQKFDLQKEGFNPTKITDPLYFLQPKEGYVPLTEELYKKIMECQIRL